MNVMVGNELGHAQRPTLGPLLQMMVPAAARSTTLMKPVLAWLAGGTWEQGNESRRDESIWV